ncbi:hypothetical protein D0T66_09295 [Dysgonomonas sp. 25]|nr:hypothetical protein [Dysgonomonas sp. 25]
MDMTRICPLCGKSLKDDETFCGDCRQLANDQLFFNDEARPESQSEPILPPEEEEPTPSPEAEKDEPLPTSLTEEETEEKEDSDEEYLDTPPTKSNKKLYVCFSLLALLLAVAGFTGGMFWEREKSLGERKKAETAFWNLCAETNTQDVYVKYLEEYPQGLYAKNASDKMVELKTLAEQEAARLDSLAQVAANKALEEKALEESKKAEKIKTVSGNELTRVRSRINELAKLLSTYQYTKSRTLMNAKVDYLGQKDKTPMFVTEDLRNTINKNGIKTVTYTPQTASAKVTKDSSGAYAIDIAVSKKIVYKDRKKKQETVKFNLSIVLDKNLKLLAVDKK